MSEQEEKKKELVNCPRCGEFLGHVGNLDVCPLCGTNLIGDRDV